LSFSSFFFFFFFMFIFYFFYFFFSSLLFFIHFSLLSVSSCSLFIVGRRGTKSQRFPDVLK